MTDTFNFLQALADYGQACVDGRIAHDRTMALEAEFIAADKAWWDARKRIITLQDQMAAALAAAKAATLPIVSTDRMQWLLNLQVGDRVRCQFQDGHGDGEIKEIHKRLADVGLRIEFTAYVCMDADVRDVGKDVLLFSGSDLSPIPVEDPKPAEVPAPPTPAATAKDESLENLEPGAHIGQSVLDGVFSDALTGLGAAYLLTACAASFKTATVTARSKRSTSAWPMLAYVLSLPPTSAWMPTCAMWAKTCCFFRAAT